MTYARVVFAGAALLAVSIGVVLIPRSAEIATMLARDDKLEEAATLLNMMYDGGDRRPEVLLQLVEVNSRLGNVPAALWRVDQFLVERPGDLDALKVRAQLLLQSGLIHEYLAVEDVLVRQGRDAAQLDRLLALYRLHGRWAEEFELVTFVAQKRGADVKHKERLGALLAERGDLQGAAHWLRQVDAVAPVDSTSARFRLLSVLLSDGRIEEVQSRARAWLALWRDPYLVGQIILRVARAGRTTEASALSRVAVTTLSSATLDVAGFLVESGHADVARHMLEAWAEQSTGWSSTDALHYAAVSRAAGDARGPLDTVRRSISRQASIDVQTRYVEAVARVFGAEVASDLMAGMPDSLKRARPLLMAELAMLAGSRQGALWYLDQVDPAVLDDANLARWLAVVTTTASPPDAFRRLLSLRDGGALQPRMDVLVVRALQSIR